MCKHIINAQVSVRAPCCRGWFDCPQCHEETVAGSHALSKTTELCFACKKCRKVFRRDLTDFDPDSDEYCPHCDNRFILPAVVPMALISNDISQNSLYSMDDRQPNKIQS